VNEALFPQSPTKYFSWYVPRSDKKKHVYLNIVTIDGSIWKNENYCIMG